MKINRRSIDVRRLAAVLKHLNDIITIQDLNGRLLAWNKSAERLYGYTESEALTMNISQLIPEGSQPNGLAYIDPSDPKGHADSFECQRLTKSGDIIDIWIVTTYLKDDYGNIDSIATTERDITRIKTQLIIQEKELKTLKGLLPICANCKEIRDDEGYWHQIESYIRDHSEATFTHSLCPKCIEALYPEFNLTKNQE
ncbi:hypothetical protein JCM14469_30620 [Desulfatiferula olefinivorans]